MTANPAPNPAAPVGAPLSSGVMRWSKSHTVSACLLGGLALAAVLASARPRRLIDAKVLGVQGFAEAPTNEQGELVADPRVILRLTRLHPTCVVFPQYQSVQFRIAGKWLESEEFDAFVMDYCPKQGQLRAIPIRRGAEAFRLHLTYARESVRNRALSALMALGLYSRAPTVCKWLTARLPNRRNWQHTVIECEVPKSPRPPGPEHQQPHNPAAAVDAPTRVGFRSLRLGPPATEQRCWQ
jgi:hypothetical protein